MKRAQRHHLKENELRIFARQARDAIEARKGQVTAALVAALIIGAAATGYFLWRQHIQTRAHAMLADALAVDDARIVPAPPPGSPSAPVVGTFPTDQARAEAALQKLKTAADAYPSTDAGIFARYHEATTLMSLARYSEAASRYDEVIKLAGNGLYG